LLTREERWQLRLLADDLTRRIGRAGTPSDLDRLERQLASVRREQLADRATRPRSGKKKERR
jgi:hypothetical protein